MGKKKEIVKTTCKKCGKEFIVPRIDRFPKFCSRKCHIEDSFKRGLFACEICGKETYRIISELNKRDHHFCSKVCYYKWQSKFPNSNFMFANIGRKPPWTGKGKDSVNGLNKDSWRKMARKIIWGTRVSPDSNTVIHHKDEDVSNNNLENLQIMSRGEHSRLHNLGREYGSVI